MLDGFSLRWGRRRAGEPLGEPRDRMMPRRFDSTKPLMQLRAFAGALGWHGLEMWQHTWDDGRIVTWYETTDRKFFLQVNEHPCYQTETYSAAVYAGRYGICTGWHSFKLADPDASSALAPWLNRCQFKDRVWRREFKKRHPECCVERSKWPPYFPDEAKPKA